MIKVYVSGPMSGIDDMNEPAFRKRAIELKRFGLVPVVPHDLHPANVSRSEAMRHDLMEMMACDAISPLDGWEESRSAKVEMLVACECGLSEVVVDGNVMRMEVRK